MTAILVIGGANVDRKAKCLAPAASGTSNPARVVESFGGVARNVAENLARLGLPVRLLSAVGDDLQGTALLADADAAGIDTRAVLRLGSVATGSYTAVLQPDGEMLLAVNDMAAVEQLSASRLLACAAAWQGAHHRVIDLNLPADSIALLLQDSRARGASLVAVAVSEPKMQRLPPRLDGLSLLILNAGELAACVGKALPTLEAVEDACRELQARGLQDVVVTLGPRGVVYGAAGGGTVTLPNEARPGGVADATGAGDAFAAGVIASLHRHPGDLGRACRLGQRAAALTIDSLSTVASTLTPALLHDA